MFLGINARHKIIRCNDKMLHQVAWYMKFRIHSLAMQ